MGVQDRPEVEWQLEALDLRPVERWLASRPAAAEPVLVPLPTISIIDIYLDTGDWRLHRAGYSLRLRHHDTEVEAEATLKALAPPRDGLRIRREITQRVAKADPGILVRTRGPVSERLRALTARRPLEVLLEIRTVRRRFAVKTGDTTIGELALDHTEVPVEGDDIPILLQRVEVEATDTDVTGLETFVGSLRAACDLRPAARSKFEAGLLARGLAPPPPMALGPTAIDPSMTAGEVAFASLRAQLAEMLAHEPGTRLGEDPEEVHDMRVATRRMRAAIALFADALPARSRWLRKELGWIARSLGSVRDLDVQLEQVGRWAPGEAQDEHRILEPLVRMLEKRRRQARRKLIRDLDSRRFERLVARGVEMLTRGPLVRSTASRRPIVDCAPGLVGKPYRRLRREGDRVGSASTPAEFHSLRIRCKRLRYALEFLGPIAPKETRAFVKKLVTVQDVLGEHQDAQVAMAHIETLALDTQERLGPRTVFVLGRVTERYDRRAAELRARFPGVYRDLRGSEWKDVEAALERARSHRAAGPSERSSRPGSRGSAPIPKA